ncbi:hypothetical protein CAter282_0140 [Collimonas arenae]|uniref:Lipoprotein n=1 Tax=Collimonas arenae TaxID=279058 RepID=A0A127QD62_9BURK|nr:hypothetical protein [Collimonas arenae]AMO98097.1 hypothetical protein CAter10_0150 [Collimonas arenae]AMP07964.1 hypothetical protein CAter282_0140 [Collimonas arenae]
MTVISRSTPHGARAATLLAGLLGAAFALGCIVFFSIGHKPGEQHDFCLAAHAAELGISSSQLTSDTRYQQQMVAALSSCTGMVP